jgi:hypothetical protein
MKHLLAVILPALLWSSAQAQTDDARADHLSDGVDSARQVSPLALRAAQAAQDALDELANLKEGDGKDVVQYYADKARSKMVGVDSAVALAGNEAGWTQWHADQAGCEDGSAHAQESANAFQAARAVLAEAYSNLIRGTRDEDVDVLIGYLTTAYQDLPDGIQKLSDAVDALTEAVKANQDCLSS